MTELEEKASEARVQIFAHQLTRFGVGATRGGDSL